MTRFVIVSDGTPLFEQLAKACINSIESNCKDFDIKHIKIIPNENKYRQQSANGLKLKAWTENIKGNTVFLDADTIVNQDISSIFDLEFDLCYTSRPKTHNIPFNSGIVFVKESGWPIVKRWESINNQMTFDRAFHSKWCLKYFGYNQAAFGCLLDSYDYPGIIHVPTKIWNCCDPVDWVRNIYNAKIIHYKGELRRDLVQENGRRYPQAVEIWKKYNNFDLCTLI